MDPVFSQLLSLEDQAAFDCNALQEPPYAASDPGYYSAASSLSPASSVDSSCFSPPPVLCRRSLLAAEGCIAPEVEPEAPFQKKGRSRSKYPGRKRQSASEREKLRMRGLTKALHHLRSYLPPSVAPAGQTLTKIETLRLAIRYIAHLSAQLGQTESPQNPEMEIGISTIKKSINFQDCYQYCPASEQWVTEEVLGLQVEHTEYPFTHSQPDDVSESIRGHMDAPQTWFQKTMEERISPVQPGFCFPSREISDLPPEQPKPSDSCMFSYVPAQNYPSYSFGPC